MMLPIQDRLTEYDVWAMVTTQNTTVITERIHKMLKHRTLVKISRYLDTPSEVHDTLEVYTGLRVESFAFGSGSAWQFAPGLEQFGFSGVDTTEKFLWRRYHAGDRSNMTYLHIRGRTGDEYDARITKQYWNEHGVGLETILVPQREARSDH